MSAFENVYDVGIYRVLLRMCTVLAAQAELTCRSGLGRVYQNIPLSTPRPQAVRGATRRGAGLGVDVLVEVALLHERGERQVRLGALQAARGLSSVKLKQWLSKVSRVNRYWSPARQQES